MITQRKIRNVWKSIRNSLQEDFINIYGEEKTAKEKLYEKIRQELLGEANFEVNNFFYKKSSKLAKRYVEELRDAEKEKEIKERLWQKLNKDLKGSFIEVYGNEDKAKERNEVVEKTVRRIRESI